MATKSSSSTPKEKGGDQPLGTKSSSSSVDENQSNLRLGTWNCGRSWEIEENQEVILRYCNDSKCDIVALQEIFHKRTGAVTYTLPTGEQYAIHFIDRNPTGEREGDRGLAFLVKSSIESVPKKHTSRIASLKFEVDGVRIQLFNFYAPTFTTKRSLNTSERFYQELMTVYEAEKQLNPDRIQILCGDFNAYPRDASEHTYFIGQYVFDSRNKSNNQNGQFLAKFLKTAKVYHLNSRFNKDNENKWTWIRIPKEKTSSSPKSPSTPQKETKSELDGFLSERIDLVKDVDIVPRNGIDHRMVFSDWNISKETELSAHKIRLLQKWSKYRETMETDKKFTPPITQSTDECCKLLERVVEFACLHVPFKVLKMLNDWETAEAPTAKEATDSTTANHESVEELTVKEVAIESAIVNQNPTESPAEKADGNESTTVDFKPADVSTAEKKGAEFADVDRLANQLADTHLNENTEKIPILKTEKGKHVLEPGFFKDFLQTQQSKEEDIQKKSVETIMTLILLIEAFQQANKPFHLIFFECQVPSDLPKRNSTVRSEEDPKVPEGLKSGFLEPSNNDKLYVRDVFYLALLAAMRTRISRDQEQREENSTNWGIDIGGKRLSRFSWKNKVVIIDTDVDDLKTHYKELEELTKKYGIEIKKIFCVSNCKEYVGKRFHSQWEKTSNINDFRCSYFPKNGNEISDILSDVMERERALVIFERNECYFPKDKKVKENLFDEEWIPSLLYNCQTWKMKENELSALQDHVNTFLSKLKLDTPFNVKKYIVDAKKEWMKQVDENSTCGQLLNGWTPIKVVAIEGRWRDDVIHDCTQLLENKFLSTVKNF